MHCLFKRVPFLFFLLLAGCVSAPVNRIPDFYWPPPPDLPRLKLEAQLRSLDDLHPPTDIEEFKRFATGEESAQPVFLKPYDVAAALGLVVVTDTMRSVVYVFDIPNRKVFPIGWRRKGKLSSPAGVAIDTKRHIYVADSGRGKVIVFDSQGHYLSEVGDPKQFSRLSDVAVSPRTGDIYALDRGGVDSDFHRISVFHPDGQFVRFIAERGSGRGQLNHPNQLVVNGEGHIFVLDAGNFRVQIFDEKGNYLNSWGRVGQGLGNLARPRGIAVNEQNLVMITDAAFQNFQIFDVDGRLYLPVGRHSPPGTPGRYLLPSGIAADETGRIYVVDQLLRKVDVWRILDQEESRALAN
jgi:DNA-binding beta-propeller fold protein YncE